MKILYIANTGPYSIIHTNQLIGEIGLNRYVDYLESKLSSEDEKEVQERCKKYSVGRNFIRQYNLSIPEDERGRFEVLILDLFYLNKNEKSNVDDFIVLEY